MDTKVCSYCHQENFDASGKCLGCGSNKKSTPSILERTEQRGEPFFYNGFMVWPIYKNDMMERLATEYQFWLGERFVDSVLITRNFIRDVFQDNGDCISIMPFIWKLFEVKCGDREIAIFDTAKENMRQYESERESIIFCRRTQMPEERSKYYAGLSWDEMMRLKEEAYSS